MHTYLVVDIWDGCGSAKAKRVGVATISFGAEDSIWGWGIGVVTVGMVAKGKVDIEDSDNSAGFSYSKIPSNCCADKQLLDWAKEMQAAAARGEFLYNVWVFNCRHFVAIGQNIGIE